MKHTTTNYLLFGLLLVIASTSIPNIKLFEFLNLIGLHALTTYSIFQIGLAFLIDALSVAAFIAGIIIGCYGFFKKPA